ncbi:ABC transporter ATP-binding protein [Pedosphaera parvula]|uniref:ABC transporter related-protein n=1 Tax=Pedosphaera parvula (strain Ellin514) TaxID=320771 RepID=B9XH04_PEDPL|nr:ABC transporter ATP-binding protein [Pedosphaera parvula]EEF60925.1 ABC transporter related-protein [Pedosphaera parvula Ellin514]
MARVVIENLGKTFKGPKGEAISAVNNLNLTVEDREFLVLVGPSGCGKTTTLRLIAGLDEISTGNISIDGRVINTVPPKDRDLAMVFQTFALYPHMTAYENMAFGLQVRKLPKKEIGQRVREAAEMLDIKDCLNRLPEALSGGQRQRVALGRAIVRKPKVFLFDEPLSNLDAPMRLQMRKELHKLHTQLGSTMIFVTHDQSEAMALGDRIAVMKQGVLQQVDQPATIYNQPANLFVANFIGSPAINIFQGRILRDAQGLSFQFDTAQDITLNLDRALEDRLQTRIGKEVILAIRPEHISYATPASGANTNWIVSATIELAESMGAETYLYAKLGATSFTVRTAAASSASPGQSANFLFDLHHAHFFDPNTGMVIL